MNPLITICARAGSKDLPGKNHKVLHGKPLYQWTLDHAIEYGQGAIVVSTDSYEILEQVKEKYPFVTTIARPEGLSQDDTPKLDVIRHAHFFMESNKHGIEYPIIIDLDVTNPLRTIYDIERCYQIFIDTDPDVLFSVTRARRNPYFNQVEFQYEQWQTPCDDGYFNRHEIPNVYDMNTSIYIYKRSWLIDKKNRSPITVNLRIYLMQDWQAFDIDNQLDFEIVEFLMGKYGQHNKEN